VTHSAKLEITVGISFSCSYLSWIPGSQFLFYDCKGR